ncbi:xanthine dehydrogenase family protein molybdopterin-binding subunit [Sulfitobacter geojensis]|uniref:xanthine dehydrogenase family protein molybdopterin-binding subunit n=1 Tax=Sulfitobacter geojensis TaxID=1342299 RepID=UPI0036DD5681
MNVKNTPNVSRRAFLAGAGTTTAALTMGFAMLPLGMSAADAAGANMFSPSMFFDIHPDGRVVVHISKSEFGQHVGTALAQILSDELECDWNNVEIAYVDYDARFGLMITGGSWSVNWSFDAMSRAGAAGRKVLIEAALTKFGGAASDYTAENSVITGNGHTISYADLVASGVEARTMTEAEVAGLTLKTADQRRFVGKDIEALDIPDKTRGQANYGIDVEIDGMVYATPATPPVRYGASVKSVDDSAAKEIAGYIKHVVINDPIGTQTGWVMAVADSYWTAKKAAEALKIEYDLGPNTGVTLADIHAESARLIETKEANLLVVNDGDVDAALKASDTQHEATYTTGMNLHMALEPMNATVEVKDGVYHIHAGSQFQTLVMGLVPAALGIEADKVVFHQQLLGGGFGRRLDADYVVMAVLTARELDTPVKMIYSREADTLFSFSRPAATIKLTAGTTGKAIDAWDSSSSSSWANARMAPGFLLPDLSGNEDNKYDPFATNGADSWYTIANRRVTNSNNAIAQGAAPAGNVRAVAPTWQFWAGESFVDEIAHSVGADPLEMRLAMLDGAGQNAGSGATTDGAKRLAKVLETAAEKGGYGKDMGAGTAVGLASVSSQERAAATWTACAAQVTVDKATGEFTVDKLTIVTDVGTAVNPRGVVAQVTGAAMWGFSLATMEEGDMQDGAITASNFDGYTPARMPDAPEIVVEMIESGHYPVGAGEPATTVVAPAIANAIQIAVGARVRSLPITADKVKAAL